MRVMTMMVLNVDVGDRLDFIFFDMLSYLQVPPSVPYLRRFLAMSGSDLQKSGQIIALYL